MKTPIMVAILVVAATPLLSNSVGFIGARPIIPIIPDETCAEAIVAGCDIASTTAKRVYASRLAAACVPLHDTALGAKGEGLRFWWLASATLDHGLGDGLKAREYFIQASRWFAACISLGDPSCNQLKADADLVIKAFEE